MALLWILLKAQMMLVGALEEAIPALQELEHALVTIPDPREGKKTRKEIKREMKGSREAGWREVSGGERKEEKNSQGKDPKTFQEKQPGKGVP